MSNSDFAFWLAHQAYRLDDSVGRIAHRAKKKDWPVTESYRELETWATANLEREHLRGLKRAYVEYLIHCGHNLQIQIVDAEGEPVSVQNIER